MKKKIKILTLASAILLFASALFLYASEAEIVNSRRESGVMPGGPLYEVSRQVDAIIADATFIDRFADAALGSHETPEGYSPEYFTGDREAAMKTNPLIAPYFFRFEGFPRKMTLSKWSQKITIGLGWPKIEFSKRNSDEKVLREVWGGNPRNEDFEKHYKKFHDGIALVLPALESLTGLEFELYEPNDRKDRITPATFARFRIIPSKLHSTLNWRPHRGGTMEKYILGAIPFSFNGAEQEHGYLIPNADNSIGLAVCRIDPDQSDEMIKADILECLVRGLGLPHLEDNVREISKIDVDKGKGFSAENYLRFLYCNDIPLGLSREQLHRLSLDEEVIGRCLR